VLQQGETMKILRKGKRILQAVYEINLNPDFVFCNALPSHLRETYDNIVYKSLGKKPNWEKISRQYQEIIQAAPDYYPARYNYTVALMHLGREAEAEPILRELVGRHPEYFYARATLLHIFCNQNRMEEAGDLAGGCSQMQETHPDAYAAWLASVSVYHAKKGDDDAARQCIEGARKIAPDNSKVKSVWRSWQV